MKLLDMAMRSLDMLMLLCMSVPAGGWIANCGGTGNAPWTSDEPLMLDCNDCCLPADTADGPAPLVWSAGPEDEDRIAFVILGQYDIWYWTICSDGFVAQTLTETSPGSAPTAGCPDELIAQTAWSGFGGFVDKLDATTGNGVGMHASFGATATEMVAFLNEVGISTPTGGVDVPFGSFASYGIVVDEVESQDGATVYNYEAHIVHPLSAAQSVMIIHYGDISGNEETVCDDTACRGILWKDGEVKASVPGSCQAEDKVICYQFLQAQSNVGRPGYWVFDITTATASSGTMPSSPTAAQCPPPDSSCTPTTTTTTTTTVTATPCGLGEVICDDGTFDPMVQCRKYGMLIPLGYSVFDRQCTRSCVCERKKDGKPLKLSCGALKDGKDPKPTCDDCASAQPTGDCSDVAFFEDAILPCMCGIHKKICGGQDKIPCDGTSLPVNKKNLKAIFKGKDNAKKICNACIDDSCACNDLPAAAPDDTSGG